MKPPGSDINLCRARRTAGARALLFLAAILTPACGGSSPLPPDAPHGQPPAAAGPASAPPGGDAGARDPRADRDFTGSDAAFSVYLEGADLAMRLPVQAAARFRKALDLDPGFAPAAYRLALTCTMISRAAEAQGAVRSAIENQERLPEPYRTALQPMARLIDGSFDLTRSSLEEALAVNPSDPHLHYVAGMLSSCSCDYFDPAGVIDHMEKAVAGGLDAAAVRDRLTSAYELKGMTNWSLSRATEKQSAHPDRPDVIAEVGRARIARGEYADAIEAADDLVRHGEDVFAFGLAPAFVLTGQHDQIAAMYDPEMERTNDAAANVLTHLHAGINDVWMGRFDEAVEHFERGPEFLPAPWEKSRKGLFYLLLGRVRLLQGRPAEGIAALEAAVQAAGPQPVLEYALGMGHLAAGAPDVAARVAYRLAKERHRSSPGWTEPWRLLMTGELSLAAGEPSRALDDLREAWNLEMPLSSDCIVGNADAYFLDALGRAYLAAGSPQDALQAFEQIRALGVRGLHQPGIATLALYRSGLALEALGREREARQRLRQFIHLWGDTDHPPGEVADAVSRLQAAGESRR